MEVGDLCRRQVVVCAPRTALTEVSKLMRGNHVGSVVVTDERRKPVGILTDRDIVVEVLAADLDARTLTAGEIMTRNVATVLEDDDISWALKAMRDHGVRGGRLELHYQPEASGEFTR